ncbi:MAG: protein translocase subunit SecF, partial [Patescibacteria group bacterium]
GIIGVVILALFMIFYYRLPGLVAVLALSLYTGILLFLIKSEMPLPIALGGAILVFIAIIYTILKSREDGWEKFVTFILACFVLFFVTFLLSNPIVLTLAGIAGVILSIGMAVDANVLIFERTKEELRAGRPLSSAIDVGFDRAWSSIRDSNFSSLITCAILFYFGTSIIQGFAFNLAAGILVSMFTAITITKTLLTAFMKTKLGDKLWLWGVQKAATEVKHYRIIERTKVWFGISGAVLVVSLVALLFFGLKLGIDFKGGTLLDLTFEKPINVEEVRKELKIIQDDLNAGQKAAPAATTSSGTALESASAPVNFENGHLVTLPDSPNQLLFHLEHMDNETHDELLAHLETKFGKVTENRFTTIGPVVGETLKKRAVMAVVVAMLAIILYIAFAFRKVPKRVSPWKFGVCAIVALLHDVLIPVGVFAVMQFEVDALFITAILTVLGFSVHDTIVVFDRIRENLKNQERDHTFAQVADHSMSQTMHRSINTSLTVLITLLSLLIFGSTSIFNFILVLVIGIVVGTYSSIFIASPLLVLWQKKSQ